MFTSNAHQLNNEWNQPMYEIVAQSCKPHCPFIIWLLFCDIIKEQQIPHNLLV
jgi:hypothetical protein